MDYGLRTHLQNTLLRNVNIKGAKLTYIVSNYPRNIKNIVYTPAKNHGR